MVYVGATSNLCRIEYYEPRGLNSEMVQYTESQLMTPILPPEIDKGNQILRLGETNPRFIQVTKESGFVIG